MACILVVDDDAALREVLVLALEQAGYSVVSAGNGEEAEPHILGDEIDLIVTDLVMPQRDGLETINMAKRLRPDTKILAMSGGGPYAHSNYLSAALAFGADETLAKPFRLRAFLGVVSDLLQAGNTNVLGENREPCAPRVAGRTF